MISAWRSRNRRSSSFLRRIQLVTSALHLLVLHDRQQGTTLARTYRPPREMGSTQSFCSGVPVPPQYAQPPHAALKADHCDSVRSCTFEAMRRLRRREYLTARLGLRDGTDRIIAGCEALKRGEGRRVVGPDGSATGNRFGLDGLVIVD